MMGAENSMYTIGHSRSILVVVIWCNSLLFFGLRIWQKISKSWCFIGSVGGVCFLCVSFYLKTNGENDEKQHDLITEASWGPSDDVFFDSDSHFFWIKKVNKKLKHRELTGFFLFQSGLKSLNIMTMKCNVMLFFFFANKNH